MKKKLTLWISIVVFMSGILLGTFLVIQETSAYQECKAGYNKKNHNQPPKENPSSVSIDCTSRVIDEHNGLVTSLATIIIAFFTGILVLVTNRQYNLTKEALAADKRAFIYANGFKSFWSKDEVTGLYSWRFRPYWHNSGDTPSKNMTIHVECDLRNSALPDGFDFDYPTAYTAPALIAPKTNILGGLAPVQIAITPQDIIDVQNLRKFLYLRGWAKYNDVFPGTKQHITRFCWIIAPMGDPIAFVPNSAEGSGQTLSFDFAYHNEGNCADDECDC